MSRDVGERRLKDDEATWHCERQRPTDALRWPTESGEENCGKSDADVFAKEAERASTRRRSHRLIFRWNRPNNQWKKFPLVPDL